MQAWLSLSGTLVGAVIALVGVYLTSRAADLRDQRNRLWDKRAEIFVDALQFLYDARLYDPPVNRDEPDPHGYWPVYTRLAARIAVFGDREIIQAFEAAAKPASFHRIYSGEQPAESNDSGYYSADRGSGWAYAPLVQFENLVHERLTGQQAHDDHYDELLGAEASPSGRLTRWYAEWTRRRFRSKSELAKATPRHDDLSGYYYDANRQGGGDDKIAP